LHNVPDTGSSLRRIQFRDAMFFVPVLRGFKIRSLVGLKPVSG
jgi:hypothetical protein